MSTYADPVLAPEQPAETRALNGRSVLTVVGVCLLAVFAGLLAPDVTGDAGMMTHYMGLLAANQPWNLLIFMAIPVILAETLAIAELVILYHQGGGPRVVHQLSRWAGIIAGPWFLAIATYLLTNAVIPLTRTGGWHGPADLIAVGAYLLGLVPLLGITLIEFGVLGRTGGRARMRLHATFVGMFLVVAHIAMIFGMLDPTLIGWTPVGIDHSNMPGM